MNDPLEQALDDLEAGRYASAAPLLQTLLQQAPHDGDLHHYLAIAYFYQAKHSDALEAFGQALKYSSDDDSLADNLIRAGYELFNNKHYQEALPFFKLLNQNDGYYSQSWLYLARSLKMLNQTEAASQILQAGLQRSPDDLNLQLEQTFLLPVRYRTQAEIQKWRDHLLAHLSQIESQLTEEKGVYWQERGIDVEPPLIALCQQGLPERELSQRIAALWSRLFPPLQTAILPRAPRLEGQKIKLALVSASFWSHSTMHYFLGLLNALRFVEDFEVTLWYLGAQQEDHITRQLKSWHKDFRDLPQDMNQALAQLNRSQPDILAFLDIGLEPFSYILASNRIAPTQIVLAGLPMTTGLKQIDYYFSGADFEPAQAQADYSETLCLTHGPIVTYFPPEVQSYKSRAELGLSETKHLYLFPLTLFRLDPEFKSIFQTILSQDSEAEIILVSYGQLEADIRADYQDLGLDLLKRIRFLGWLSPADYLSLLHQADVVLDGLRWGAGNVAFLSLWVDQALLTCPSQFLRCRIAAGLYHLLELPELIADDLDAYTALALKMGTDAEWRQHMRAAVKQRKAIAFQNMQATDETLAYLRQFV